MISSVDQGANLLVSPREIRGDRCEVRGAAYRHLFRARRLAVGEPLRVVDGEGRARAGRVAEVGRAVATIELGAAAPSRESACALTLLVGTPRPQRAAWLVEKATELGVVAVRFLATERGAHELGAGALERLRRVAVAAVEQCGRARLPEVTGIHAWRELPELLAGSPGRWICDLEATGDPPAPPPDGAALALVGPEGGWTASERAAAIALGCRPLPLAARPLRVETAALAAAALLLAPSRAGSVDTLGGQS